MKKLLDCTLRDGGYINNWTFGEKNSKKIVEALNNSNVDFIELGYLSRGEFTLDNTKQSNVNGFSHLTTANDKSYLCMINFGDYDIDDLPNRNQTAIDGIRLCFKKKEFPLAIEFCKKLAEKGYKVFVQPMVTISYTDEEFISLINLVNKSGVFAFYLVDSFGEMTEDDIYKYFNLVKDNLNEDIFIGFHSHNNLQLSYSNCKAFMALNTKHNLIVDSSIFGMGRGAGNLNTEIFMEYMNNKYGCHYNINPIIDIIDKVVNNFYVNQFWGYSIPFYLSAKNHCHPNYASFLEQKKTLTFFDMNKILKSINQDYRLIYNKEYINALYKDYQNRNDNHSDISKLKEVFNNKEVILIAPGPSSKLCKDKIISNSNNKILVSVNFIPEDIPTNYNFVSNNKRFSKLSNYDYNKMIVTTNIETENTFCKIPYFSLINDKDVVSDNAGLMAVKLMILLGVKKIFLAGFDGYSLSPQNDYANEDLQLAMKNDIIYLNDIISSQLKDFAKDIQIEFLTEQKNIKLI